MDEDFSLIITPRVNCQDSFQTRRLARPNRSPSALGQQLWPGALGFLLVYRPLGYPLFPHFPLVTMPVLLGALSSG
jgi:hypothetical protein